MATTMKGTGKDFLNTDLQTRGPPNCKWYPSHSTTVRGEVRVLINKKGCCEGVVDIPDRE